MLLADPVRRRLTDMGGQEGTVLTTDPDAVYRVFYGSPDEVFDRMDLGFPAYFGMYPNPVGDALTLEVYMPEGGSLPVSVRSVDGREVLRTAVALAKGLNRAVIDLRGQVMAKGLYYLRAGDMPPVKFIKE